MAAAQPVYDYSNYDYSYETSSAAPYLSYSGYESGTYDSYAAAAAATAYPSTSSYTNVDPYSGYPATSYGYASTGNASSSYDTASSSSSYTYDSRRVTGSPPPPSSSSSSSSNVYAGYATSATGPCADYTHPSGVMAPPHLYMPGTTDMFSNRADYYPSGQIPHTMHYVHHQPQRMPYRLPPRGGYQRELDEPGDENALLRHVIYITGLPKEIQNETLAEVFGAVCGQIAPVDVRSPKPKIWVYKDRQTREGKGEATITFINPESCQVAINYFNGKELFGREVHVALCPRRIYNMQKQNTPFNPAAPPTNTTISVSSITKPTLSNNNGATIGSTASPASATSMTTSSTESSTSTATTNSSDNVTTANPIATISSSTLGLPRQINHSLFKLRQTAEQQRGLLPTPPNSYLPSTMNNAAQRDGVRKELPRIALNRGNSTNPGNIRSKPY